jgi:hypothetical protein
VSSPNSADTKPNYKPDYFASRHPRPLPGPGSSHAEIANWLRDWAELNWDPKAMLYQQIWDLSDSLDPGG